MTNARAEVNWSEYVYLFLYILHQLVVFWHFLVHLQKIINDKVINIQATNHRELVHVLQLFTL